MHHRTEVFVGRDVYRSRLWLGVYVAPLPMSRPVSGDDLTALSM